VRLHDYTRPLIEPMGDKRSFVFASSCSISLLTHRENLLFFRDAARHDANGEVKFHLALRHGGHGQPNPQTHQEEWSSICHVSNPCRPSPQLLIPFRAIHVKSLPLEACE
jgi:hypothetical protein